MGVVGALLNDGAVVKRQTVVVLDGSVPFVGQLDLAIRESVDLVRL